jgi:hypothetical protein
MADGLGYSQDITINSCRVVGASGNPIDIRHIVVEINYFEDIFSNFVNGALVVNDSIGCIQMFEFQGQEVLFLSIDKPGLDKPLEKVCRIYKHSGRTQTKTSNENYILHFCSEEAMLSEQYKISKAYANVKILDIVKDIVINQLKVDKKYFKNYDETTGVKNIVIPNLKPLQAINWLTTFTQADQDKNAGAFYLFYEDKAGFNFKSVLNLYKQPIFRKYQYEEKNLKSAKNDLVVDLEKEFVNVIAFEHVNSFDSITAVKTGAMANKTITIDPLRLKFDEKNYDYNKYIKDVQSLDKQNIPNSATNRLGDKINETFGAIKFCVSTSGQSENKYIKDKEVHVNEYRPEETSSIRSAQLSLMWSNRIKILVPGDVELTIGKIVEFNKPEISYNNPNSKEKVADPFYSGRYLVTAVRHTITQEHKFTTVLELCKDSYPNKFSNFDNSDSGWKGVR